MKNVDLKKTFSKNLNVVFTKLVFRKVGHIMPEVNIALVLRIYKYQTIYLSCYLYKAEYSFITQ